MYSVETGGTEYGRTYDGRRVAVVVGGGAGVLEARSAPGGMVALKADGLRTLRDWAPDGWGLPVGRLAVDRSGNVFRFLFRVRRGYLESCLHYHITYSSY